MFYPCIIMMRKEVLMDTLGTRLRWARERRLWSQQRLSDETGVMVATISRIENGRHSRRPLTTTLEALASALGVDATWLVFGEDDLEGKAAA
jgi:transcriptional regulator with XRE-family HTH domain